MDADSECWSTGVVFFARILALDSPIAFPELENQTQQIEISSMKHFLDNDNKTRLNYLW
jgi:hypothetical protein